MHAIYQRIYRTIGRIPRGRVATYGQIAALAGVPGRARQVGYALRVLSPETRLAWHRVVNARGEISHRRVAGYEDLQRGLLEREGIIFDDRRRLSLTRYRWRPERPGSQRRSSKPPARARSQGLIYSHLPLILAARRLPLTPTRRPRLRPQKDRAVGRVQRPKTAEIRVRRLFLERVR